MRWLGYLLTAMFLFMQYQLWFAAGGMLSAVKLQQSINHQQQLNQKASKRNAQLAADIKDLKSGNQAVEERARRDLGMVKKGEVFYQVVK